MLLALTAGQKTGLALMAAVFVLFALTSALWIPRSRPDFPGRGLRLFVLACVLLTLAMLGTVIALAGEKEEEGEHRAAPEATQPAAPPPAAPPAAPPAPAAKGDPVAGKRVFLSQGCGGCHRFAPAGTSGQVGPDLASLETDAKKANRGSLEQYVRESIVDPNAYVVPGFQKGVMPTFDLSEKQLDDVVSFLTQKS